MDYVCITKCFFRGRLWYLGETISPEAGETLPKYFAQRDTVSPKQAKVIEDTPKTFKAIQDEELALEKKAMDSWGAKAKRAVSRAVAKPKGKAEVAGETFLK